MKSLKLNYLENRSISRKEMQSINGGETAARACTCSCYWEGNTGSSIEDNKWANFNIGPGGGYSKHGENEHWVIVTVTTNE